LSLSPSVFGFERYFVRLQVGKENNMALGNELDLIPVITRLGHQAKSLSEALNLFQRLLAEQIGAAQLLLEPPESGTSPSVAQSTAAFLDSHEFPFRGLYTVPLNAGSRKAGRLIACFASFGVRGRSLPVLATHIAGQLSEILARTTRTSSIRAFTGGI
jgi:hypothetical protein